MSRLNENIARVRQQIADAAARSGRNPQTVTLVAVTKYVGMEIIRDLVAAGCNDLGEARPQALWTKSAALARQADLDSLSHAPVRWHLIGHLQRNKVEQSLPLSALVHSVDSIRLLEAIDQAASTLQRQTRLLIEVNVSGDGTKHGFSPDQVVAALDAAAKLNHISVQGLMCMAAREGDLDVARRNFAALRELRDALLANRPENVCLNELSMGMSADFVVAIEEGATMVRVGSALYQGLVR
jgi:pyridoxal phosphate enzyme (YggS family)